MTPFHDLAEFVALPRLTGLVLSPDGSRLVATVQQPDAACARYTSSLWEIDLTGEAPRRLTFSDKGETAPAFCPDGSLLFLSARPDPAEPGADAADEAALWSLPRRGEARVVATRPGGVGTPVVAAGSGDVVLTGTRLTFSDEDDDAERRGVRRERKLTAILHTGMPIRHWDHELGAESVRLLHAPRVGAAPYDLVPDATTELVEATYSISADGTTVATSWRVRRAHGQTPYGVALVDTVSGERAVLAADEEHDFAAPMISPDGARVAVGRDLRARYDRPLRPELVVLPVGGGEPVVVDLGDLHATEWAWSHDSATLWVSGELHGRGAVVAADPLTGAVELRLACDAAYTSLCPTPDGTAIYALRSAVGSPPRPVRLDTAAEDQTAVLLASPAPPPALPGELVEVWAPTRDGARVHAWVCLPPRSGTPAPVMLWIHGGPFMSTNAWSWRWNPWVAVAQGWAVVMPDPAHSTGYGQAWIERAWPYRAEQVYADCAAALDEVLASPDLDETRLACLGGSFGGYMANWVAGHVDRFAAVVSHAGLYALDQQHKTTDAAAYKVGIFGEPADQPEWYAANSPHHGSLGRTPMLVVHGNRDYRVPVSEALRLWWDLVSSWDGAPATMPHRFLQFTGENHWVLTPGDAEIWYDAVLGFCGEHVLGRPWRPSPLL